MNSQVIAAIIICLACISGCNSLPTHPLYSDSGYYGYTSHVARPVMELMIVAPDLLPLWTRESKDSHYVYPNEFNCQERKDVTVEWIRYASQIDSLGTMVFSWSNVTDEMLEPLFLCDYFDRIYLDGLDLKFETIERFVRMENVYSVMISDTDYDQDKLLKLRIEFPDKEIED